MTVDYIAAHAEAVHAVADGLHSLADRMRASGDEQLADEDDRIGRHTLSAHQVLTIVLDGIAELRAVDLVSSAADADWQERSAPRTARNEAHNRTAREVWTGDGQTAPVASLLISGHVLRNRRDSHPRRSDSDAAGASP